MVRRDQTNTKELSNTCTMMMQWRLVLIMAPSGCVSTARAMLVLGLVALATSFKFQAELEQQVKQRGGVAQKELLLIITLQVQWFALVT